LALLTQLNDTLGNLISFAARFAPETPGIVQGILLALQRHRSNVLQHLDVEEKLRVLWGLAFDADVPIDGDLVRSTEPVVVRIQAAALHAVSLFVPESSGRLVDFVRCAKPSQDETGPAEHQGGSHHYVAFLTSASDTDALRLVDLGNADVIDPVVEASLNEAIQGLVQQSKDSANLPAVRPPIGILH
jgi:hypothetical protein